MLVDVECSVDSCTTYYTMILSSLRGTLDGFMYLGVHFFSHITLIIALLFFFLFFACFVHTLCLL